MPQAIMGRSFAALVGLFLLGVGLTVPWLMFISPGIPGVVTYMFLCYACLMILSSALAFRYVATGTFLGEELNPAVVILLFLISIASYEFAFTFLAIENADFRLPTMGSFFL